MKVSFVMININININIIFFLIHHANSFSIPSPYADASQGAFQRFKRLQNQFDLRGVALANDPAHVTLSPVDAFFVGKAFATWLLLKDQNQSKSKLSVAVGRDSRLTGHSLSYAILEGIDEVAPNSGVELGLCTTPATFHSCLEPPLGISAKGSIMVTASHLPPDRNGMKFFRSTGGLSENDVNELIQIAASLFLSHKREAYHSGSNKEEKRWKEQYGFLHDVYGAHLVRLIREKAGGRSNSSSSLPPPSNYQPLAGFHVIVNPGHGAGGFFVDVLKQCGAKTGGSLNLVPDGNFPSHPPNPEDPQAMKATVDAVRSWEADLGVIFDPDCDRLGLVQKDGTELNRNRLIAMAAAVVLREHPGTTVVTDSVTSNGLGRFIRRRGGSHLRFKKGYRNVIEEAIALNERGLDCQLAMECSGHAAFKENRFLDDGAFLAVKLLGELASSSKEGGGGLGELIKDLEEPAEYAELRLKVKAGYDRAIVAEKVLKAFEFIVQETFGWEMEEETYEGLRARVDEGEDSFGWLHFRASLHDPIIALTMESDVPYTGLQQNLLTLVDAGFLQATQEFLDCSTITQYLERKKKQE